MSITFLNTQNVLGENEQNFSVGSGHVKKTVRRLNGLVVLVLDYSNYTGDEFDIEYSPPSSSFTAVTTVKYNLFSEIKYDSKKNTIKLNLTNNMNFSSESEFTA